MPSIATMMPDQFVFDLKKDFCIIAIMNPPTFLDDDIMTWKSIVMAQKLLPAERYLGNVLGVDTGRM